MALMVHEIICIGCPLACRVKLTVDDTGAISEIAEYQCKIGKEYAENEYKSPQRVLTATVKTEGSVRPLLPVRTDKPVPKDMIRDCMSALTDVRAKPALTIGSIVVQNILGTGVDLVCTDDLPM
jgi:CxxC motif-containing protein